MVEAGVGLGHLVVIACIAGYRAESLDLGLVRLVLNVVITELIICYLVACQSLSMYGVFQRALICATCAGLLLVVGERRLLHERIHRAACVASLRACVAYQ